MTRDSTVGCVLNTADNEALAAGQCPVCGSRHLVKGQRTQSSRWHAAGDEIPSKVACFACYAQFEYAHTGGGEHEWVHVA